MSSHSLRTAAFLIALLAGTAYAEPLRICADPDNLPFSNRAGAGFDNRIAVLLAGDLGRQPVFVWLRSGRGFIREQFNKNACDLVMGVPEGMKAFATTEPYYRSSYVFVTRARDDLRIASFSDPRLANRRIGLQMLGEDFAPPALPLLRTGNGTHLVGFQPFGERAGDVVRAVAHNRVGLSVVWAPVAGFYAWKDRLPLTLTAVEPAVDPTGVPFAYSLTIGVHKRDDALRLALNRSIDRLRPRIAKTLRDSHVPVLGADGGLS